MKERIKAAVHIGFCVELYNEQVQGGRWFLHEQPAAAQSWNLAAVKELSKDPNNQVVLGHMCRHGMHIEGEPALKPTKRMTSADEIAREVGAQCDGNHDH